MQCFGLIEDVRNRISEGRTPGWDGGGQVDQSVWSGMWCYPSKRRSC